MSYTSYGNVLINAGNAITGSHYIYTSTGTNGTWTNPTVTMSDNAAKLDQSGTLELKGKNADLKINGVSLSETLEVIQEMLGIMRMDPALEQEFDELKRVGQQYRDLRGKFQEQKAVWDTLKKQDL